METIVGPALAVLRCLAQGIQAADLCRKVSALIQPFLRERCPGFLRLQAGTTFASNGAVWMLAFTSLDTCKQAVKTQLRSFLETALAPFSNEIAGVIGSCCLLASSLTLPPLAFGLLIFSLSLSPHPLHYIRYPILLRDAIQLRVWGHDGGGDQSANCSRH